jgi:hypothetical protein
MHNVLPAGPSVCRTCHTFVDEQAGWTRCIGCSRNMEYLDLVVPITYSVNLGQMHLALRRYKDGYYRQERDYARARIAAILWRFLETHEPCVATATGVGGFEVVTAVPSSTVERDEDSVFRTIVSWCAPVKDRLCRVLAPTGKPSVKHQFQLDRFEAKKRVDGKNVLLLDDTWTTGSNAQAAAYVLKTKAGAGSVALVVIGRHVNPEWEVGGQTCAEIVKTLPPFDWGTCCVQR